MAEKKKPTAAAKPVKKQYNINKIYDGGKARNKSCPKCGPGIFLANHKDRDSCGKCNYTEKK